MNNMENIKRQIQRLVAEGRGEEAREMAEAVSGSLTAEELQDLNDWVVENTYQVFRPFVESEADRDRWMAVAGHMKEGESLKSAFPRLPDNLQDFVKNEAKRFKGAKLH